MENAHGCRLAVEELSESQKICLRLVKQGLRSKEISRVTGLSPQTVDQYMSRAAAHLNVTSRHKAADLLASAEAGMVNVSELRPSEVAPRPPVDGSEGPPADNEQSDRSVGEEGPKHFRNVGDLLTHLFHVPPVGGRRHALDPMQKMAVIIRVALTALVAVSALVALMRGAIFLLGN